MAMSPTLEKPIALGYVPVELSEIGTTLTGAAEQASIPMVVTRIPFYDPEGTRVRV